MQYNSNGLLLVNLAQINTFHKIILLIFDFMIIFVTYYCTIFSDY